MTLDEVTRLQQRCIKALDDFGAPTALRKFCLAVVEYEEETAAAAVRMHEELHRLKPDELEHLESLRSLIQNVSDEFRTWKRTVDTLVSRGEDLPALQAPRLQGRSIQAPSAMQTKKLHIKEFDQLTVTDASQPDVIKVRTKDGQEDLVPILSCILPSSDKTVASLLRRLQVQLLSSWTDCLTQSGKLLIKFAKTAFQSLDLSERKLAEVQLNGSSIVSRIRTFREIAKGLETEIAQRQTGRAKSQDQETVKNLLKLFNDYQLFFESWNEFRLILKKRKPQPICIFENITDFQNQVSENKPVKCYTTTFTVESTELREETIHVPMSEFDDDASSYGAGGFWKQVIEAEQLTSTCQEEKRRYIIKGVRDPRTGKEISLSEAIQSGIVDMTRGLYVNPDTKETRAMAAALGGGDIKVDYVTKTQSVPKTEALGLITVRDRVESRKYTIRAVIDARTAERVDLKEAKKRGLVDDGATQFVINTSGEKIDMDDAVEDGWVLVEYEAEEGSDEPVYQTRTYAVRAVVDQRLKKRVPFLEAVQRRLVERDTGNYHDNVTGETIHALEAIRRGFLKAKLIEDPTKLDIDPMNKTVVQGINRMKCLVTGLGAVTAMKESVSRGSTSSNGSI